MRANSQYSDAELSLLAHTGTQDDNLNKHTQHAQKQFEHSGEAVPETQMEGGTNACERTARLMPTAAPRCPIAPSEFLIQSSFGQTVRAEPNGFLFSFLFTSLLSASSKSPRQCGHHNIVMTRLKCDYWSVIQKNHLDKAGPSVTAVTRAAKKQNKTGLICAQRS